MKIILRKSSRLACIAALIGCATLSLAADPFTSNNGLYPAAADWDGRFLTANLNYEMAGDQTAWKVDDAFGPLTVDTAPAYAARVHEFLEQSFKTVINTPDQWDPVAAHWYDMVWIGGAAPGADGKPDPNSGREALMNTYSGQVLPAETFSPPYRPTAPVQNHALIYYNSLAAHMLGRMWSNTYAPDLTQAVFPDGSVVAKIEAVTNTPKTWPVVTGAGQWEVFRPTTQAIASGGDLTPQVIPVRPFQMAIRIKDSVAAPETGWVFALFVYDAKAKGATPWDRFRSVGLQWGNDPDLTSDPSGLPPGTVLTQTWISPDAPDFITDTVGWGGRLAGPMDVATRHNVVTVSGQRFAGAHHIQASSCQSCHGSSEFPFTANLYPSPNKSFPRDGEPFLLYDPGSPEWAAWFQNRPGTQSMSRAIGGQGLDYDMALMFAVSSFNAAVGNDAFVVQRFDVH